MTRSCEHGHELPGFITEGGVTRSCEHGHELPGFITGGGVTRSCEHGHELPGFITGREFLDYLKKYQLLEKHSAIRSFSITHAEVFRKNQVLAYGLAFVPLRYPIELTSHPLLYGDILLHKVR